jgi:RNA polymerase sigma-B factor
MRRSSDKRDVDTTISIDTSLLTTYWRTRDPSLRDPILHQFRSLIHSLAHRFARGGVLAEDLVQVASIGLLSALRRFDPDRGVHFATYALSTIVGEIKHHFRDHGWAVKVPRPMQGIATSLPAVEEALHDRLGRSPTIPELAQQLGTTEEDVLEAMALGQAYQPRSLDTRFEFADGDGTDRMQEMVGAPDAQILALVEYAPLRTALAGLDEQKRQVVSLRHFEERSQREVGRALGISQMQVSRLERQALEELRDATQAEYATAP